MNMNRLIRSTAITTLLLATPALFAADAPKLETLKDKVSYAVGVNYARNLKRQGVDFDPAIFAAAMADVYSGREPALSEADGRAAITAYQQELQAKQQEVKKAEMEKAQELGKKNREAGAAFLAENAKKVGVKIKEVTLPNGKKAEFQYKILTEGKGEIPRENHQVKAAYRGTLIDGTQFDAGTHEFGVTQVIKGWTEALLMMPVGSKWQLFIPADLAYEDQQRGEQITPGSTLIFEIELLSTKGPEPIVSDIIKVPSAEEMKKGAKIETIKAEDVEKLRKEQEQKK
ncbi:MAG: hypothetical protein RLY20_1911 [Verrucomicrobiota bacterium]